MERREHGRQSGIFAQIGRGSRRPGQHLKLRQKQRRAYGLLSSVRLIHFSAQYVQQGAAVPVPKNAVLRLFSPSEKGMAVGKEPPAAGGLIVALCNMGRSGCDIGYIPFLKGVNPFPDKKDAASFQAQSELRVTVHMQVAERTECLRVIIGPYRKIGGQRDVT